MKLRNVTVKTKGGASVTVYPASDTGTYDPVLLVQDGPRHAGTELTPRQAGRIAAALTQAADEREGKR